MNNRWTYQLVTGGLWALFMIVFSTFFVEDMPFQDRLTTQLFWIKFVSYFALGIFVLGYVSWKGKQRRASQNNK